MAKKWTMTKPEDCTHPDCFSCPYHDCIWSGRLSYDPVRQQAQRKETNRQEGKG